MQKQLQCLPTWPRGVQLLRAAAVQKNPEALCKMGGLAAQGGLISKDAKAAMDYYIRSAAQGFVPAEREAAAMFASGLGGKQDDHVAYFWATLAASQGDQKSIHLAETLKPHLSDAELAEIRSSVVTFLQSHQGAPQ